MLRLHTDARQMNGLFHAGACCLVLNVILTLTPGVAADAGRTLAHEAIIDAPVADVWELYTTTDGARKWMAPKVEVDLRVGGTIRASYDPDSNLDDEHTIINRILAYEPMRMLAMRNEQAPSGFDRDKLFQHTWFVAYFEPLGERRTKLRLVGLGFGEGPLWGQLYNFFRIGNQQTLNLLKQQFEPIPDRTDEIMELLGTLVGGEWLGSADMPDGNVLRSSSRYEFGPDGVSIVSSGRLGLGENLIDHGRSIVYRAAAIDGGGVRYFNINEFGAIARGEIRLISKSVVEWDWNQTSLDGAESVFRITMSFLDDEQFRFTLMRRDDEGDWHLQVEMIFERRVE